MSEFKAQILGIIIVISLFILVSSGVTGLFQKTWEKIDTIEDSEVWLPDSEYLRISIKK